MGASNVPTNRTIAEPPSDPGLLDVAKFLAQQDKWTEFFEGHSRQTDGGRAHDFCPL